MGDPKRYLILKGYAGLGNRMQAFLSAVLYAKLTHRQLKVDWSDSKYSNKGENIFSKVFVTPFDSFFVPENLKDLNITPPVWNGRLDTSVEKVFKAGTFSNTGDLRRKCSIDLSSEYDEDVAVYYHTTFEFKNLRKNPRSKQTDWTTLGEDELFRRLLNEFLKPTPEICAKIRDFHEENFLKAPVIGVHIRQTDNMRYRTHRISVDSLKQRLQKFLKKNPDYRIYISTDNLAVLEDFKTQYGDVISYPKWYPKRLGDAIHGHPKCSNRLRIAQEAVIELYLLAGCQSFIYSSRSSFGRISKDLSLRPLENNINIDA